MQINIFCCKIKCSLNRLWDHNGMKYNANEILIGDKSLISRKWDETYQEKISAQTQMKTLTILDNTSLI